MRQVASFEAAIIKSLRIPAIRVNVNDVVGVSLPIDYGEQWLDIMRHYQLAPDCSENRQVTRIWMVTPGHAAKKFGNCRDFKSTVGLFAGRTNVSDKDARRHLELVNLDPRLSVDDIGATERLLLGIAECLSKETDLLLITTAGLAPQGYDRVLTTLTSVRQLVSSINFFPSSDLDYYSKLNCSYLFDRYTLLIQTSEEKGASYLSLPDKGGR